ncbi:MAG: trigger factor [Solirubrobacteraceae bacterium]|jgi:trigger factor|nr:trigger factor [Solirubrobacteraceae bacterium]
MSAALKTTITELPDSRVRVEAEVPPEEVERSVQRAAAALGRDLRMPGFRKGKVPPPVVIQRMGRDVVVDEAVRGQIGRWYLDAIDEAGIHPVGDPQLDIGDLPAQGQPLQFSIEIGVRPTAKLGTYKGVEVGRREPAADDEAVQGELDALRERSARLETVDEPAAENDFIVMDYRGTLDGEPFEGGEARDQLIELGSGRLVPGFEEQLTGAKAGDERTVTITFPDDYGADELKGREAEFAVTVNEVKRKELPELDDDFASDAAGFDTLDELREDIRTKLREADENRVEAEFREAVLDAVVDDATVDVPEALVEARAREMWERMIHTLSHQGISREGYLQIAGKSEEEILSEASPDAEQAIRREAVIAAVIDAEDIQPSDGDVLDALQASAAREGTTPEKLRERLEKAGRLDEVKEDLAQRAAVDFLAENAKPLSEDQARARDKLWTPDQEYPKGIEKPIWTPGS